MHDQYLKSSLWTFLKQPHPYPLSLGSRRNDWLLFFNLFFLFLLEQLLILSLDKILKVTYTRIFLHNTRRLRNLPHIKCRLPSINTRRSQLGISRNYCTVQNYTAVPDHDPWPDNTLFTNLYVRSDFHRLDDCALVHENVTPDLNWNVTDLVVLLFEWGFDDHSLVQDHVTTDEYLGQVSAQNYLLLQNRMIVNFDIIRAFYQTLFAD